MTVGVVKIDDVNVGTVVEQASPFPLSADANFAGYKAIALACDNGTTFPTSPSTGQWYLHTTSNTLFQYNSGWMPVISYGAQTLYVDPTNGSDADGQGYSSGTGAVETIQKAFDLIPPIVQGDVNVYLAAGTYPTGTMTLSGKTVTGTSSINIFGDYTESSQTMNGTGYIGAASTLAYITDSDAGFTTNSEQYKIIRFTSGSNLDIYRPIRSNTTSTLTLAGNKLVATPVSGDTYSIYTLTSVFPTGCNFTIGEGQKGVNFYFLNMDNVTGSDLNIRFYGTGGIWYSTFTGYRAIYCSNPGGTLQVVNSSFYMPDSNALAINCSVNAYSSIRGCVIVGTTAGFSRGIWTAFLGRVYFREGTVISGWDYGIDTDAGSHVYCYTGGTVEPRIESCGVGIRALNMSLVTGAKTLVTYSGNTTNYTPSSSSDPAHLS